MDSSRHNPWLRQNWGAPPPRHPLGIFLSKRKLATSRYVPSRWEQAVLTGDELPFDAVITYTLMGQQTLEFQTLVPDYFAVNEIAGGSFDPAGVQALFSDPSRKRQFFDQPVHIGNFAGDGRNQRFLKHFYPFAPHSPILAKVSNLATEINRGEIVFRGHIITRDQALRLGLPETAATSQAAAAPATGGIPPSAGAVLTVRPPWIERPASGRPFAPSATIALPNIGETATVVAKKVPVGWAGVVRQVGVSVQSGAWRDGDGRLMFQFQINGVPCPEFEALTNSYGEPSEPREIEGGIRLRENDVFSVVVINVGLAPAGDLVTGTFGGWFYPKGLDAKWVNLW